MKIKMSYVYVLQNPKIVSHEKSISKTIAFKMIMSKFNLTAIVLALDLHRGGESSI